MDDTTWQARATLDLVAGGGRREWNEQQVADALREAGEAGMSAHELHGEPRDFAEARLAERPPGELATIARDDRFDDHLTVVSALLLATTVGVVNTFVSKGWTTPTTPRMTAFFIGLLALTTIATVATALRRAGRVRAARRWWWAMAPALAALIAGIELLPRVTGPSIPTPTPLVVAGLAALALGRLGSRIVDRSSGDWFDDLAARLVGRHDLSPALARGLAADSRAHWEQVRAGTPAAQHPAEEFGELDAYAAELAVDRPVSRPLRYRLAPYTWRLTAVPIVVAAVATITEPTPAWQRLLYVPAALIALWVAVGEWRGRR